MFQVIWAFCSVSLIFTILIHNPKSQGFGSQNQLFSGTRSAEETLNKITWSLIVGFFTLTIYLAVRATGL